MSHLVLKERMTALLHQRQQEAVVKLHQSRGGIVWWKVGEGKTRIGLFLFASLQALFNWQLPSICLVVCRRNAFLDWREEIERCFSSVSVYENEIPSLPPGSQPVFLLISTGMMEKAKIASLQNNLFIRFVILDELWLYANNKSARSKAAYLLTKNRKSVGLSGTIMKARDTSEVYSQAMAVQKHRYLADSITKFRSQYQKTKFIQAGGFPIAFAKKGSYKKIMAALEDVSDIHFPSGSRVITEQFHNVEPTAKQKQYFHELKEFYSIDELDVEYDHVIVISTKAQQIANGWLKTEEGGILNIPSNKYQKLEDEIQDIIMGGYRVVVWCAFRYDVKMLAAKLPFASVQMLAGHPFDVDTWRHGDARICLATEASGSSVNHFVDTPYAIYFSANYKWLDMQQSRGRTDRGSASRHAQCFYKYLQVAGSMDSHVYRTALASGRDERKLITEGVKLWLQK